VSRPLAGPLRAGVWACRGESLPSGSSLDLISDKPNRWNTEHEATIYLSGDPGLALLESGRHPDDLEDRMRLLEVDIRIPRAVDIRDHEARAELSLPGDLDWVLDHDRTREVAYSLRLSGKCDALIVPSAGALDQPERFNLVIFADDPERIPQLVGDPRVVGKVVVDDTVPAGARN
jgi:RES domain-containing protein